MNTIVSTANIISLNSFSPTVYDGKTLYVGGTGEENYTKIQDAIDNARDGDTVFVYSRTYYENVVIKKSIYLIGENRYTTIIDGNESGDVVRIFADRVNIGRFTIQNSGDYDNYKGIYISSNYNTIIDNYILNNVRGISLKGSIGNSIEENAISLNEDIGIFISNSDNNTFCMNQIFQNGVWGILVHNSNHNIISSNEIYKNRLHGISIQNGSLNSIIGNKIYEHRYSNTWGITSFKENYGNIISKNTISKNWGGIDYLGNWGEISKNNITNNKEYGIYLRSPGWLSNDNNIIKQNNISTNKIGIYIYWSCDNIIEYNNVQNNKYGVSLIRSSDRNLIQKNNFIMNEEHAIFTSSRNNFWHSNYWDDWIGFKIKWPLFQKLLPKVIIDYSPLFPVINFDWHPATQPYDIPPPTT